MKRTIILPNIAPACYFKTAVEHPYRKALVQITEQCNLHCLHCFLSAGDFGNHMPLEHIQFVLIPRLKECRVVSITLTGGEPFKHSQIIKIVSCFLSAGFSVSICTNATCIKEDDAKSLAFMGNVKVNVSLDGFTPQSHGMFRGSIDCFDQAISTIKILGKYGLLHGILVTPNNFAQVSEYEQICSFASEIGASYVLMNPLSSMGRGTDSINSLAMSNENMRIIREKISHFSSQIELTLVRFPNDARFPLSSCEAGNIIYIFTNGDVAICPYIVFAARSKQSVHKPEEFIVGNIFSDSDIAERLDGYSLWKYYHLGENQMCSSCRLNAECGKGCPAAVVASGSHIKSIDVHMCPNFLA